MRFKAITVFVGAVAALAFASTTRFGGPADAADAKAPAAEAVKIPEFVPIVNFSEFVLAMQSFAAQNPTDARIAAEALSEKFAAGSDGQKVELHKPVQQAAAEPAKAQSVIITRPVAVAEVPAMPDPNEYAPQVADPVKVITGYPVDQAKAGPTRQKADKKAVASADGRSRLKKEFEPAMGLGMMIESAEEAPPMSSLPQKKRKVKAEATATATATTTLNAW